MKTIEYLAKTVTDYNSIGCKIGNGTTAIVNLMDGFEQMTGYDENGEPEYAYVPPFYRVTYHVGRLPAFDDSICKTVDNLIILMTALNDNPDEWYEVEYD
jgi:hypothetical protein